VLQKITKSTPTSHEHSTRVALCNLEKCNQALIVGFGDNDHATRGLMRFIEMTSKELRIEDVIRNGGTPNYKR
jgi:hypothetical protein